jgi:DNA primase
VTIILYESQSHICHIYKWIRMDVLELAHELGLSPKRSASTHGGEYKSKCPKCQEGTDRFCIWPKQGTSGRYWCRVCNAKGDGIQFCRDFLGMSFHQACLKTNVIPSYQPTAKIMKRATFTPHPSSPIHPTWKQAAQKFIELAHERLMNEPLGIDQLAKRGFTIKTIQQFNLGWNPENLFQQREAWGLSSEVTENGSPRRQWLPKGIVIPSFLNSEPAKIKIRRSDWFKEDTLPKYVEISGSNQSPSVYGDIGKPVIIVESELDAIVIQQSASHLICSVALGGVSKKPDTKLHALLKQVPLILLSLDFDEAGKRHYSFWMKQYPNLRPWPSPQTKSVGNDFGLQPADLAQWIMAGLHI